MEVLKNINNNSYASDKILLNSDELEQNNNISIGKQKERKEEEKEYKTTINNVELIYNEKGIYESVPIKNVIDGTIKNVELQRQHEKYIIMQACKWFIC